MKVQDPRGDSSQNAQQAAGHYDKLMPMPHNNTWKYEVFTLIHIFPVNLI